MLELMHNIKLSKNFMIALMKVKNGLLNMAKQQEVRYIL
jgi:hypothetical protein|nr:MAG TPA: hypothetical protein [Caudoviricetes sp.]